MQRRKPSTRRHEDVADPNPLTGDAGQVASHHPAPVTLPPIVYIDRRYLEAEGTGKRWPRLSRRIDEPEWEAWCDKGGGGLEGPKFRSVDEAIAWGREHADVVLVRLGTEIDAAYSAGSVHAAERADRTGWAFPPWPPSSWPDYNGPPEEGWPEYFASDDA